MHVAHDTAQALAAAVALLATHGPDGDRLADPAALATFVRRQGWSGALRGDAAELAAVRALRTRLRGFWSGDVDTVAALANALLAEAGALPQLVAHDGWGHHLHATPRQAPLADRIAVEAAMAVAEMVRLGELDRLGTCAAPGCGRATVDLSRNRSRRFCGPACANRVHAAASRARRDPARGSADLP